MRERQQQNVIDVGGAGDCPDMQTALFINMEQQDVYRQNSHTERKYLNYLFYGSLFLLALFGIVILACTIMTHRSVWKLKFHFVDPYGTYCSGHQNIWTDGKGMYEMSEVSDCAYYSRCFVLISVQSHLFILKNPKNKVCFYRHINLPYDLFHLQRAYAGEITQHNLLQGYFVHIKSTAVELNYVKTQEQLDVFKKFCSSFSVKQIRTVAKKILISEKINGTSTPTQDAQFYYYKLGYPLYIEEITDNDFVSFAANSPTQTGLLKATGMANKSHV